MTSVKFLLDKETLCGFEISGHSTFSCDDIEGKLVCSAISSAAYLVANTISEIAGDKIEAEVEDGYMKIIVSNPSNEAMILLEGLRLHIRELSQQYQNKIGIITEV